MDLQQQLCVVTPSVRQDSMSGNVCISPMQKAHNSMLVTQHPIQNANNSMLVVALCMQYPMQKAHDSMPVTCLSGHMPCQS